MTTLFEKGTIYRVTHRTFDNKKVVKAKRKYLFTEMRFGSIPCYCFTSRIARGVINDTLVSIPEHDLVSAEEVTL